VPPTLTSSGLISTIQTRNASSGVPVAAAAAAETWVTRARLVRIVSFGDGDLDERHGQVTDLVSPPSTSMTWPVM
jgi:hypothetical protein